MTNSAYLLGGRGINIAARVVYAVVLTRYLGPELYGLIAKLRDLGLALISVQHSEEGEEEG